jgi:hypothetical protein
MKEKTKHGSQENVLVTPNKTRVKKKCREQLQKHNLSIIREGSGCFTLNQSNLNPEVQP